MKIIALDSSGLVASVAILEDDVLLAEYSVNYKKTHSQTLLPMLDEIANMIGLDKESVDAIAVAAGPGSFTGLRIGSATAKGLGLALGKPIIEVPTLAGMAYNLPYARGLVCPVMDARRQQVYNGIYRFEGKCMTTIIDQRAIAAADLIAELNDMDSAETNEGVIFLGDGSYVVEPYAAESLTIPYSFAPPHLARQSAASVGALAMEMYRKGEFVPADAHAPIYLRKSQAEQERERRNM
ncbi:MAG: tRNA (adenosine(37)-N6)-threonylcarbamoyltransferase complex dimerization subunit type 1 TsaB [Lachnospiraceae bacterium]|nr:tRNA (adenosine(37)-N6)-threonylcarbamoyltransferase complex dimerization subunit type 1 TsaB [Lachnospiraceae bacterium]